MNAVHACQGRVPALTPGPNPTLTSVYGGGGIVEYGSLLVTVLPQGGC
jgi:hypothetical protein